MGALSTALAKRPVVAPTWLHAPEYVYTDGPQVANLCAEAGFAPYPEQEMLLDLIFAVGDDGLSAAFEVGVIVSRQQLKTGLVVQAMVGWLYVTQARLVVYSAHNLDAVGEAFRKTREVITGSSLLSKYLPPGRSEGIRSGKGDQSLELRTGTRAKFMTRTSDNGRSLTGDKVIVDEGFAYTADQAGALEPTLASVADPQKLITSSAGKAESESLRDLRDRGRAGVGERLVYAEWGDRDAGKGCRDGEECDHKVTRAGCALDDEDRWRRIMPRHDARRLRTVRDLRKSMPPKEFAREFLVWWDDPGVATVSALPGWDLRRIDEEDDREPPEDGMVLGVSVAAGGEWSSIGAAARWDDGLIHLGAVDRRPGTKWLTRRLEELQGRLSCAVVLDAKVADAGLAERLDDNGVETTVWDSEEVSAACSWLVEAVRDGDVTHFGHTELDAAVRGAVRRYWADNKRFAWGHAKSEAPVDMLDAVTYAGKGVELGLSVGAFNIY